MRSVVFAIIAAGCIVAACSVPTTTKRPALDSGWPDTGTPPATIAMAAQ